MAKRGACLPDRQALLVRPTRKPSHFVLGIYPDFFGGTAIPCREFINFTKLCAHFNKGDIKIPSKKAANIFILSLLPLFLQAFNTTSQLIKLL
jgi:hypothetical protein